MSKVAAYSIRKALSLFDIGIDEIASTQLVNDSRSVNTSTVFCAVIGTEQDGREYIPQAIEAGALLIISQCPCEAHHGNISYKEYQGQQIAVIQFFELAKHLSALAQAYYGHPAQQLCMIGITGTNGKTSTSQMLAQSLDALGNRAAVIGTTGAGQLSQLTAINNTTPGPTELNQLLAQFVEQGVSHVVMEVSSHALDQHRIQPSMFDVAVFTNLSRDHLDYHQTMEAYAAAKFSLFANDENQLAVLNIDDEYAKQWIAEKKVQDKVATFSSQANSKATLAAQNIAHNADGILFELEYQQHVTAIATTLFGDFNVENLLTVSTTLIAMGFTFEQVCQQLPKLKAPMGRMEHFSSADKASCIVDYAHTPDALENALIACRQHCHGELWVLFGCGGDRDKGKRSLMGEAAEKYAEHIVITNDNPRSEAPELIANDILSGIKESKKVTVLLDREQAVRKTLSHAKPNDVVLVAGKGHEENILIGDTIVPYSERALVKSLFEQEASE